MLASPTFFIGGSLRFGEGSIRAGFDTPHSAEVTQPPLPRNCSENHYFSIIFQYQ